MTRAELFLPYCGVFAVAAKTGEHEQGIRAALQLIDVEPFLATKTHLVVAVPTMSRDHEKINFDTAGFFKVFSCTGERTEFS